jgi:hypothetical protein
VTRDKGAFTHTLVPTDPLQQTDPRTSRAPHSAAAERARTAEHSIQLDTGAGARTKRCTSQYKCVSHPRAGLSRVRISAVRHDLNLRGCHSARVSLTRPVTVWPSTCLRRQIPRSPRVDFGTARRGLHQSESAPPRLAGLRLRASHTGKLSPEPAHHHTCVAAARASHWSRRHVSAPSSDTLAGLLIYRDQRGPASATRVIRAVLACALRDSGPSRGRGPRQLSKSEIATHAAYISH